MKFISIDEEGYFHSAGVRWTDQAIGKEALSNLSRNDAGVYYTLLQGERYIVEAFDQPLVAHRVEPINDDLWRLTTPYDFSTEFSLQKICSDEWDRFLGRTIQDLSFVMNRSAQEMFFTTLTDFDDDGFSYNKKNYKPALWPLTEGSKELAPNSWDQAYIDKQTGWDLGGPHPSLPVILPQIKLNRSRILVVGAGAGHDAAFLAKHGHFVTALDFSSEAIKKAKELYGNLPNLNFIQADALHLPTSLQNKFDVVFEHTCYCAINPKDRNQLVRSYKQALVETGQWLAILPLYDKAGGPPFASSEWELRKRLNEHFQFLYWSRTRTTATKRLGQELVIFANKK